MLRRVSLFHRHGGLGAVGQTVAALKGVRLPRDDGISDGLKGFGDYGGSIAAFVRPEGEEGEGGGRARGVADGGRPLPCGDGPAVQEFGARRAADIALGERLPSPQELKLGQASGKQEQKRPLRSAAGNSPSSSLPRRLTTPKTTSALPKKMTGGARDSATTPNEKAKTQSVETKETSTNQQVQAHAKEAEDYYRTLPRNAISKEEMWNRISLATADKAERFSSVLKASEADYLKMEEELKEHDLFHYRMGEIAYPDTDTRRNYYAMWQLAMSLNKARWTMLDVHSQRGVKTTGAGIKLLFWKESVNQIIERRQMTVGQFTDSHPVLRPFAVAVEQNPHMTKAFVRGFTDARLRVLQQPGNMKQLFEHFDRYYGYFFNSLLEVTHVKDENAEHMMQHIGRAIGLTQHCVMLWKKYAQIGFTMLPADLCADNYVNIALLKNISLASRDRAVRKLLYDVMCVVKTEMLHAQELAPLCSPTAWAIVMECTYANYYLGFLQRRDFNVSAMFADHNIENAGYAWYRVKKRWEWERHQSIKRLVAEEAPLPFIGTSFAHRGSSYKMASGIGRAAS